jgi:hypothetical protein
MHHRLASVPLFASLLALTAHSQVLPGDIGVTGFSANAFGVATPPSVTP